MTEEINAEELRQILREEIQRSNEIESEDLFILGLKVLVLAAGAMVLGMVFINWAF